MLLPFRSRFLWLPIFSVRFFFIDPPQKCRQCNCDMLNVHVHFPLNLFLYVFLIPLWSRVSHFSQAYIQCFSPHSAHCTHKHTTTANTSRFKRMEEWMRRTRFYWLTDFAGRRVICLYFAQIYTFDSFYLFLKTKITENPLRYGRLHFFTY